MGIDPRFTADAKRLIQDIQLYHVPQTNRIACSIFLHDGTSADGTRFDVISHETDQFSRKLEKLIRLPQRYNHNRTLSDRGVEESALPKPQSGLMILSSEDGGCLSRDAAQKQAGELLYFIGQATGLSNQDLLDKVNRRGIPESIQMHEAMPYLQLRQNERVN